MKQRQQTHRVSLDNLFDTLKAGEMKTVNVIIKADQLHQFPLVDAPVV